MVIQTSFFNENALIADQLGHYVKAISDISPMILEGFPFYLDEGHGVLAAIDGEEKISLAANSAITQALQVPGLKEITVLASGKPAQAPDDAQITKDKHWILDLPVSLGQKTRNMLHKAARRLEMNISTDNHAFTNEHLDIIQEFADNKKTALDDGSRYIFGRLSQYVNSSPAVMVFSARSETRLEGFAIADFTSFNWAYYMFAFRRQNALPGTADFLLHGIIDQAEKLGFARLNLGLGINEGVEFFKQKWGAKPVLRHVESAWKLSAGRSFFVKLVSKIIGK